MFYLLTELIVSKSKDENENNYYVLRYREASIGNTETYCSSIFRLIRKSLKV